MARFAEGGAIGHGPGRRMEPAPVGYLVPGTHAFAFPASVGPAIRIFVDTPEDVIAQRLSGGRERGERAKATIRKWLGANPQLIAAQAPLADFVIDGTVGREEQLARFMTKAGAFFGLAPPG